MPQTILVVDDDPGVLDVVRQILETQGFGVLAAASGEEALKLAQTHAGPIALLLADVVMLGLSGPETAARLAASRPETRVLYMSGFTTEVVQARGLRDGDPLIVKPFSPEKLAQRIKEVVEYRSPFARPTAPPRR
jgi:DNA-binding response OmpR family regulator